jgi:hypothetical protein
MDENFKLFLLLFLLKTYPLPLQEMEFYYTDKLIRYTE